MCIDLSSFWKLQWSIITGHGRTTCTEIDHYSLIGEGNFWIKQIKIAYLTSRLEARHMMRWCTVLYRGSTPGPNSPWASCQKRRIARCACAGNDGNVFPSLLVSDFDMHHGTCVTHVPWCTPGSLTSGFLWHRSWGNRSRYSGACATRSLMHLIRGHGATSVA